jgi:hypothetical protein
VNYLLKEGIVDHLLVSWWEPFIWKNLSRFIDDFNGSSRISIFTNWSLFKDWLKEQIKDAKIKLSLHWLINWDTWLDYYINAIQTLEDNWAEYWLIYMISYKNFNKLLPIYKKLRNRFPSENFSFKFQPLVMDSSNKMYNSHWLQNMNEDDRNVLENWIYSLIEFEWWFQSRPDSVYAIWPKNIDYFNMIKDTVTKWMRISECPTWPILSIASNWDVHPCINRFDLTMWNIYKNNIIGDLTKRNLLESLSLEDYMCMKKWECYNYNCIWVCSPPNPGLIKD